MSTVMRHYTSKNFESPEEIEWPPLPPNGDHKTSRPKGYVKVKFVDNKIFQMPPYYQNSVLKFKH